MHIVQLANFYGPRSGGLRTAVDTLGSGYVEHGHDVTLVVPARTFSRTVLDSGVVRITVPAPTIVGIGQGYRAANSLRVAAVLSDMKIDAIEVSDRLTLRGFGRWARRRGIGNVMISHERLDRMIAMGAPGVLAEKLANIANRHTSVNYDTVVCTTAFAREEFDRIDAHNVRLVPLGVDHDFFGPWRYDDSVRSEFARGAEVLLVHCGRLSVEKEPFKPIDALRVLRDLGVDARLVVMGDGAMLDDLRRYAAGDPVTFTGFISHRERVGAILASADVAICPGPHETFGLAAFEALASGTPVVVSARSALASVVDGVCGAASRDSGVGFAEGVSSLLALGSAQRRAAARKRAAEFSWSDSVEKMLAIHEYGACLRLRKASVIDAGSWKRQYRHRPVV